MSPSACAATGVSAAIPLQGLVSSTPSQQHRGYFRSFRHNRTLFTACPLPFSLHSCTLLLYSKGYSCTSVMNLDLNKCLNNFFWKITGDILITRLFIGNNFTIIFLWPYRFYCITSPAHYTSLWVIGSVREHYVIPTGSKLSFCYYSGQKDLLLLMYGDLERDCCILPPCHSQGSFLYFKSDNK